MGSPGCMPGWGLKPICAWLTNGGARPGLISYAGTCKNTFECSEPECFKGVVASAMIKANEELSIEDASLCAFCEGFMHCSVRKADGSHFKIMTEGGISASFTFHP